MYAPDLPPTVIPDLIVEEIDGEYRVFTNDTRLPRLRVSESYRDVVRDGKLSPENREFIESRLDSAQWMVRALEQRRHTMLLVMEFIVEYQRDFFERGEQYIRPMTLADVADATHMHQSTVSRVTHEKYVDSPRGVLPLRFFFSGSLRRGRGEVSARFGQGEDQCPHKGRGHKQAPQ